MEGDPDLSHLPVVDGFRMRGEAVTRLETFVDAAFAFAVTLLVVSFNAMPTSFADLYEALRRLPAFLAAFAILAMFWQSHNRFSRRYGLEDGAVLILSLSLVAATLFYVYPLRMVISAAMQVVTGGWAQAELELTTLHEFRLLFVIYGVGFASLAAIMAALNWHALRHPALRLDAVERMSTRGEVEADLVLVGSAVLSIALALLLPLDSTFQQMLPGFCYSLLGIALPWQNASLRRRIRMAAPVAA
jgi:uncharacterized membrane protein